MGKANNEQMTVSRGTKEVPDVVIAAEDRKKLPVTDASRQCQRGADEGGSGFGRVGPIRSVRWKR
jgi:hypothetical protein